MEKMLSDVTGTMVYNPCCETTTPNMAADQWLIDYRLRKRGLAHNLAAFSECVGDRNRLSMKLVISKCNDLSFSIDMDGVEMSG